MSRPSYDPFKDESLGQKPSPRTRIRVDWKRGARLLAGGETADAVAATLGIDEDRLWRHLNKSLRFQFLFRQALERQRLTAQLQFEVAGRKAVVQRCGTADTLDSDSLQWLAREAGITADAAGPAEGRGKLIARLAETGTAPPNQARHKHLKAERKAMDAQFAELKAWGRSAGVLPPAAAVEAGLSADKTQISENKIQISEAKTQISEAKTPVSGDKSEVDAAQPAPDDRPFPRHLYRSVIDLTDLHGNPLPGVQHLRRE